MTDGYRERDLQGVHLHLWPLPGGADRAEWASGPVLLILHGLFGSGDNWRAQAQELASGRMVIAPDLPNHGRSAHVDRMDYPWLAERMWQVLDDLRASGDIPADAPVDVLGHSMGGKVAMAMSFQRPGKLRRLVVADIAPREYPPRHEEIFRAMHAVAGQHISRRGEADRIMEEFIPERPVRLFLLKSLTAGDAEGDSYRWQLNLPGLSEAYPVISDWPFSADEQYAGPVLFIAGGTSPYVRPQDYAAIGDHFPDHRIETIPGAGHWLHVEAREHFVSLVRDFLA